MTKDEHIAKLREALKVIADTSETVSDNAFGIARGFVVSRAREALSLPSSSEPPQLREVTAVQIDKALTAARSIASVYRQNFLCSAKAMRAALQAVLWAKP